MSVSGARDEQMFLALERARVPCLVTDSITGRRTPRTERLTCLIIRADNQASSGRRTADGGRIDGANVIRRGDTRHLSVLEWLQTRAIGPVAVTASERNGASCRRRPLGTIPGDRPVFVELYEMSGARETRKAIKARSRGDRCALMPILRPSLSGHGPPSFSRGLSAAGRAGGGTRTRYSNAAGERASERCVAMALDRAE